MDGYSYYNIFETKGLEYIIIIVFLLLLIPFSLILNSRINIKRKIIRTMETFSSGILKIPQGIFFSDNHTWAHLAKSGIANVGLDGLVLNAIGRVTLTWLKKPGDPVRKGEAITEIGHEGKRLKIYSPVSGLVTAANPLLDEEPWMLNEDPYESGWLYKIRPSDWKAETGTYYLADAAVAWSQKELVRFRDFLAISMPDYFPGTSLVALQDGGELRDQMLADMPGEIWDEFQLRFLDPWWFSGDR